MSFDIAFLTNMFPEKMLHIYQKYGFKYGDANVTFIQTSLVEGLDKVNGRPCHVINKALLRDKRGWVPKVEWRHFDQQDKADISFSYLNIPFFSSNLLFHYSKTYLKQWLRDMEGQGILLAYGATNHNYQALAYAKKKRPDIKTGLIVPDLPENTKKYGVNPLLDLKHKLTNRLTNRCFERCGKYIDVFFPFSEHMCSALQCEQRYSVLEGVATDTFAGIQPQRIFDPDKKIVLYGGGLNKSYGLDILLEAFAQISDPDYRLVLCGKGDYVSEIQKAMEQDTRITFLGTIPREDLLAYQLGADVLVNPRNNKQIFSMYSFPSKNMEYLSSGVPFVGFKLGGIPDEYDPYISYPEEESAYALAEEIIRVCGDGRETALNKASAARKFVLERKNKFSQAQRMYDRLRG